ncbi:MAG: GyrI-like domain-containing protein [Trueperaceae bacterium]|nr:GyrI-like domain-containing protein [Trueperaceae bacterium]
MITEPKIEYRDEKRYMGIRTIAPFKGMFADVDKLIKELRVWVKQQGLAHEGPFFLRYYVIDMDGPMDIELGFMVSQHLPETERIKAGVLPAGNYAHLFYKGSGLAGNKALLEWVKREGISLDRWQDAAGDAFRCRYEAYLTADKLQPRKSKGVDLAMKVAEG